VAGTIGVVSMAARSAGDRGGHDRARGRPSRSRGRPDCGCAARFRRRAAGWRAQVRDAAMLAFPWASIRFVSPRFAPARSSSVPPACSTAALPQPGAAPSPEWRDRSPLAGAGKEETRSPARPPPLDRTTARPSNEQRIAPRQPSHPALRRPSSMWAWSSGRLQGTRSPTYMSNEAGAMAIASSSALFASSIRPSWPSAAARQR
jgi:hypothetical protein